MKADHINDAKSVSHPTKEDDPQLQATDNDHKLEANFSIDCIQAPQVDSPDMVSMVK
jgi:hypothetical protein